MTTSEPAIPERVQRALDALSLRLSQPLRPDEQAAIVATLTESEERFGRLRTFSLENGDQPAPGFHPYRRGGKGS